MLSRIEEYNVEMDDLLKCHYARWVRGVLSLDDVLGLAVDEVVTLGCCWKGAWDACALIHGCTLDEYLLGFDEFDAKVVEIKKLSSLGGNIGKSLLIF